MDPLGNRDDSSKGFQDVEVELVDAGGWLRMIWRPAMVGLLTYLVGMALLLARAQARDRLPVTASIAAILTLMMPAVLVAVMRSTRSGMSFRREIVRFNLRSHDRAILAMAATNRGGTRPASGYAVIKSGTRGLTLVTTAGETFDIQDAGLVVRLVATRRGTVVGVNLTSGANTVRRFGVGPSRVLAG
jgi:hypothetical protein